MAKRDPCNDGPLQFGRAEAGRPYADRPCAYGLLADDGGRLALVRVEKPEGVWRDLPGGALDPGENEVEALVREFSEETGLRVAPDGLVARAGQYMVKAGGEPVNNLSAFYAVVMEGAALELKVEDDHTVEWWAPPEAMAALRHDSHAWAVAAWLRARARLGRISP